MDRQAGGQAGRQVDRQAGRQAGRQAAYLMPCILDEEDRLTVFTISLMSTPLFRSSSAISSRLKWTA